VLLREALGEEEDVEEEEEDLHEVKQ